MSTDCLYDICANLMQVQLINRPKWPKVHYDSDRELAVQSMSAKEAKYGFGRLIDLARAEPVVVEKHGRPVVVVLAIEEYKRLHEAGNLTSAS